MVRHYAARIVGLSNIVGEKPGDLPGAGADQVRIGNQPQAREGARVDRAACVAACADEVIE